MDPLTKQPALPSAEDVARGYTVGKWREHDNFECLKCEYATLWEAKMQEHIDFGMHEWSKPGQPGTNNEAEVSQRGRGPTY